MEANKAYLIKKNIISIEGQDKEIFLQNIITNDINKLKNEKSIYAALLSPQGKILFDFIIIQNEKKFLIEVDRFDAKKFFEKLVAYKLRSKVEIKVNTNLLSLDVDNQLFKKISNLSENIVFFEDPRFKNLSFRALINLKDLLNFSEKFSISVIDDDKNYCKKLYETGIPPIGFGGMYSKIFAINANLIELNAIDQKKGCYVGQEVTARMHLRNKNNKRLFPATIIEGKIYDEQEVYNPNKIGKIIIYKENFYALLSYENFLDLNNKILETKTAKIKIIIPKYLNKLNG